jgi:hypothetical protein
VSEVQVVLVELSGILHDIIAGILDAQPDIRVAGDLDDASDVARSVDATGANFVIWGVDGDVGRFYPDVIDRYPRLKVVAVQNQHHNALLWEMRPVWEMRPSRAPLGELSPDRLLAALREAPHG